MKLKRKPKIAYFPSGTMNDFGTNFDLNKDYICIANRLINPRIKEFDVNEFMISDKYATILTMLQALVLSLISLIKLKEKLKKR